MPDAIILCGGAGLRLRTLTNAPKSMATVAGRPFLELLLHQLRRFGVERVILAIGYQGDAIRSHFNEKAFGLNVIYSEERVPLGTGGALRKAADCLESKDGLVLNGDSYTTADIRGFVFQHRNSGADVSVLVVPVNGRSDCGIVATDRNNRLIAFDEKQNHSTQGYMNAGLYMVSRDITCEIPDGAQISLEREVFPRWIAQGKDIRAIAYAGACVDIGTPDRYRNAQIFLSEAETPQPSTQPPK